ncbi:MAG: polymer-forming cytoskeletal protein [Candidatus Margulisbacteria bacterium]|nr:polymer-forming cytoskeletal protein [Candidatus Margulisiibacteriota bacterium]
MKKKLGHNQNVVSTLIGEESEFKGTIQSIGSVHIEGKLEGEIRSQGEVYVGLKSKVKASIYGKRVIIAGEVTGNIEALNGLKICTTGRVYGDISGDRLIVEEGAIYKGKVNMDIISSKNLYEGNFELVKAIT